MYYGICRSETETKPYQVLSFKSLAQAKRCEFVDEFSILYSEQEPKQLIDNWQQDELEGTWVCILLNDKKALKHFSDDYAEYSLQKNPTKTKFHNIEKAAQKLHELVLFCVKPWKEEDQMKTDIDLDIKPTLVKVDQFNNKAQKTEKKKSSTLVDTTKIVALMDAPPISSGTNRYRNMKVILGCTTVAEAIKKLKALSPAPGSGVDIKIAVKAGAIKLEE